MKKKILSVALVVAVLAIVVGGTLAYFTDDDKVTNTFTFGSVLIDIIEAVNFHVGIGCVFRNMANLCDLTAADDAYFDTHNGSSFYQFALTRFRMDVNFSLMTGPAV